MKVTIFTSNQPRHLGLINCLADVCEETYVVQECNTVFPGRIKDVFDNSPVMDDYFGRMRDAEREVFGDISFLNNKSIHTMAVKSGDLNAISKEVLRPALESDIYVVFGASYIRDTWLIDFLLEHKAINIHMGVSPYYRGAACNFWALYDGRPEMVGATIMYLGKGLDSGDMLYHAVPKVDLYDPFVLGMQAVKVAHESLRDRICDKSIFSMDGVSQNRNQEMRYSKNKEFTESVAGEYLDNLLTPNEIKDILQHRDIGMFTRLYEG